MEQFTAPAVFDRGGLELRIRLRRVRRPLLGAKRNLAGLAHIGRRRRPRDNDVIHHAPFHHLSLLRMLVA